MERKRTLRSLVIVKLPLLSLPVGTDIFSRGAGEKVMRVS